jgi:alginate O-acetyltransferase complex protein AlgI
LEFNSALMLFNSISFAIFLPIVFVFYWLATGENLRRQNILLLIASYYFYACWDWRFLFLLIFSTVLDYYTGIRIHEAAYRRNRLIWLWLSIGINLGFLGVFKYYNFFVESMADGLSLLGVSANVTTLKVILPVGISFYTFHGLSYVIDLYKDRIKPEKNFIDYSLFVSFFPLLVAGPIERATHLLPQIVNKRVFNNTKAADGLRQILWGLFKKIVIADNCAKYANEIFNNVGAYSGSTLALGAILFAFQIYCDFSGYSDIALGTARLFGIELLRNFAFPYFSRDIAEFWRRWHISLSSWFRDYVYIPLVGSKGSLLFKIRNTFIIFLLSGFWHGANWTFIFWGLLNALYFLPLLLSEKNRVHTDVVAPGKLFATPKELLQICVTFGLTVLAWVFFRAEDLSSAVAYLKGMFTNTILTKPEIFPVDVLALLAAFIAVEWLQREKQHALQIDGFRIPRTVRWGIYYAIVLAIAVFGGTQQEFIYFQF